MHLLRDHAIALAGVPYKWGGSNPVQGFDCSGFVEWILRGAGIRWPTKVNAQVVHDWCVAQGAKESRELGSLAFYGPSLQAIDHVAFCIDPYRIMECGGGDHLTLTDADAAAHNACVRMNLIEYRPDFLVCLKPSYAKIGAP